MSPANPTYWNDTCDEIYQCLDLNDLKSFFLFAGAGSGKTRTLVEVLKRFRDERMWSLRLYSQKIAIITYTNAACDEIRARLQFDEAFHVSTIHSFAWSLIQYHTEDIRVFIGKLLRTELESLEAQQEKAKDHTKRKYKERQSKINRILERLASLDEVSKFTYNPVGENTGKYALSHDQVIAIAADFIANKPTMQNILIRQYPILFIDECQDTKKSLVEALLAVHKEHTGKFCLGMFGDTMQRIYMDGKSDLVESIDDTWAKPALEVNYRSPRRVVRLINKIRAKADGREQQPKKNNEGVVRLFLVHTHPQIDKRQVEASVFSSMVTYTSDPEWDGPGRDVKVLTLEHHMAAKRGGFSRFFEPLYQVDEFKTGLFDGKLEGISLLKDQVVPLVSAKKHDDEFAVATIMREHSPLLSKEEMETSDNPMSLIEQANHAVESFYGLWQAVEDPTLFHVLRKVHQTKLFPIPDVLLPIVNYPNGNSPGDDEAGNDPILKAWKEALKASFSEFEKYVEYISDESPYGTHQGIKGLEFPRVMVIMDDEEAKGNWFSYEKIFGVKEPSNTDISNLKEGKDTSLDRTLRLLYVTCSRAEQSLAVVVYTMEPQRVKETVLSYDWFSEGEIIIV